MKRILVLAFISCQLCSVNHAAAQIWTSGGPYGAVISGNLTIGSYLYVATNVGVFKTNNNGQSWEFVSTNLPPYTIGALYFDGTTMYAGIDYGQDQVYTSADTGKTWTLNATGLTNTDDYNTFCSIGNKVFIACTDGGIYYTTNSGSSWAATTTLPPFGSFGNIYAAAGDLFVAPLFGGLLYRSVDEGQSWNIDSTGMGVVNPGVLQLFTSGNTIYAAGKYIFSSTDNGDNWTRISDLEPGIQIPYSPGIFKVLCFDGTNFYGLNPQAPAIYKNTLGNNAWVDVTGNYPTGTIADMVFNVGTQIFVDENGNLFTSSSGGTTWSNTGNHGMGGKLMTSIVANGNNIAAGANDGSAYYSNDNGQTWDGSATFLQNTVNDIYAFNSYLLASTNGYGIYKSTDNGQTWTSLSLVTNDVFKFTDDGTNLFVGVDGTVNKSIDGGASWSPFGTGWSDGGSLGFVILGNNIFGAAGTVTSEAGIYKSPVASDSWTLLSGGLPFDITPTALEKIGGKLYAGMGLQGVYASNDSGSTWSALNTGIETRQVNDLLASWGDLFAATDSGIYVLHNGSSVWQNISYNLPALYISELSINDNYLFAAINGGSVWQIPLGTVGIAKPSALNDELTIAPNPVSTQLIVGNGVLAMAEIEIRNTLGQIVYKDATVNFQTNRTIDVSKFPSGIYLLSVKTSKGIKVGKFVKE